MNRRVLLWLIAIALLATVGCRPRHPPHTPQPLNMMGATSGFAVVNERQGSPMRCDFTARTGNRGQTKGSTEIRCRLIALAAGLAIPLCCWHRPEWWVTIGL
jgi:hypothetical protein